jgi:Tol biopolymer transport system component
MQGTGILGKTGNHSDDRSLYVLRPLGLKFSDTESDARYQSFQDPLLGDQTIRLLNEQTRQSWTVTTTASGRFYGMWFAPKRLTWLCKNTDPVWSPDSVKLAYQSDRDGKWQVYVVDVASKAESCVVTDSANDEWATWNCTSDKLVFQTDRSGDWELVYYGLDGQQRGQTTDNPAADVGSAWNPGEEDGSLSGMGVVAP